MCRAVHVSYMYILIIDISEAISFDPLSIFFAKSSKIIATLQHESTWYIHHINTIPHFGPRGSMLVTPPKRKPSNPYSWRNGEFETELLRILNALLFVDFSSCFVFSLLDPPPEIWQQKSKHLAAEQKRFRSFEKKMVKKVGFLKSKNCKFNEFVFWTSYLP